jgi:ferredoxin
VIAIADKTQCCGCAACASACPADCIEMKADEEGFLYPVADVGRCTSCDLCEKVCPVLQNEPERERLQNAYLVQHKDAEVLLRSTSGGAFTAIAEHVLDCGGVVFGAAFDGSLRVRHVSVDTRQDLRRLRNSKYVQSDIGDAFRAAFELLEQGRTVCFSGTPCQIEGLQHYVRKDYPNLLKVDVVCHAVPSPLVFQRYLAWQAARADDGIAIGDVVFRDKTRFGYEYSSMCIYSDSDAMNRVYAQGVESDPYLRAFFSNICDRPSCYQCSFKKRYRESDLTLWDCFDVGRLGPELDNNGGVTRVLVHSERGEAAMQLVADRARCIRIDPETAVAGVREMFHSVPMNEHRAEFFDDCIALPDAELFPKWFGDTTRVKLERMARLGSEMLGVYQPARRLAKRILGR